MELSFKELKKREVINLPDGRSLGYITDLTLDFPAGKLSSITVPGKKSHGIFSCFNKSEIVIDESKIMKIGNDVILVSVKIGVGNSTNIDIHGGEKRQNVSPCPPPCPPCPPDCPPNPPVPPCPPRSGNDFTAPTVKDLFGGEDEPANRIDLSDY